MADTASLHEAALRRLVADEEHLKLLPVFYWVLGGLDVLVALYGLVYVGIGVLFATIPWGESAAAAGDVPPSEIMWVFVLFGIAFMLFFGGVAAFQILTGFWIRGRRRRVACLVCAGISCLFVPFGTLLGILTFMALTRPTVVALFDEPMVPVPDVH